MPSPDLSDYVTVAQRIAQFREKHPDGSLRPLNPDRPYDVLQIGDFTMLVVVAAAYRSPEDALPGVGMAAEPFPGRTPYTRGSELMNAETSAWGRAIVAALRADTSLAIASQDEVRNRREDEQQQLPRTGTNASLREAGRMDRQQKRDHEQLAADTLRTGRAERSRPRGPDPDDPWAQDAPVDGERAAALRGHLEDQAPEDRPGTSDARQHRALGILYSELGITERDTRLAEMTDRVGRAISSAKDLSYTEAEAAIRELTPLADAAKKATTEAGV